MSQMTDQVLLRGQGRLHPYFAVFGRRDSVTRHFQQLSGVGEDNGVVLNQQDVFHKG